MQVTIDIEDHLDQLSQLSPVEFAVYVRVGKGVFRVKELLPDRSEKTAASHLERIKKKLGLSSTREIFMHSFKQQLIRDLSQHQSVRQNCTYKLLPKTTRCTPIG